MIDIYAIAINHNDNPIVEWDVKIVNTNEFIGVIERHSGPVSELDVYAFTDVFKHMTEFDTFEEARNAASDFVNSALPN